MKKETCMVVVGTSRIRRLDEDELDGSLFDDSEGYEDEKGYSPPSYLSERERRQAKTLYRLFHGLWGLCIIRGDPGAGKDTFLNWFLYTCKRFFPDRRILRDEKPRKLFGPYAGLFNEQRIHDDLKQMRESVSGVSATRLDVALEEVADKWASSKRAQAMLRSSIIGLTEFWKYVYNREPHNPMNKTMGGIHKMKRRFPTLIVGGTQLESDLDKKTCKPFIDWRVVCTRSQRDTTRYTFLLERVRYDKRMDLIVPVGRVFPIPIDAGRPRKYIGDGKIVIRKPNYRPETEEERIVLTCLKAGVSDYDELVAYLENVGDMSEFEILQTLKDLCLNLQDEGKRPKFAIWYPCVYFLFNSRSAPNLRTAIKVGD